MGALVEMSAAFFSSNTALGQKALQHLKACPDFHIDTAQAAAQIAKISSFDPGSEAQVTEMAVTLLIPQDNTPSTMAPGQECALLSSWVHALLRHVLDLKKKEIQSSSNSNSNEDARQRLLTESIDSLVLAFKLSTKRLKAVGADKFSGGKMIGNSGSDANGDDGNGISKLLNLALQGYRACVEALELGFYDQCVTLSSSTCVLLEDLVPSKGLDIQALQSNVLLLAAQSLLSTFHGSLPTTAGDNGARKSKNLSRLHLARKMLKKSAEKASKAVGHSSPHPHHQVLYPAVHAMLFEVASLQGNQADMMGCLQALTEASSCSLSTDVQIITVIQAVSAAPSNIKSAACTALLHTTSTAGFLSIKVLGELLTLAQGSKQKLEVVKQAMNLNSGLCTLHGLPPGEQSSTTSQQQRLQQQRWLAAECYNTGVFYSRSNPRNAIPFIQVACDLDPRLNQVCSSALEKLKPEAAKQPPSPPRPKAKNLKKPEIQTVSQPIALEDGSNDRARPHSVLPTVGNVEAEENGVQPPVEEKRIVKICTPQPSPPSAPAQTTADLEINKASASLVEASPIEPESALKRKRKPMQKVELVRKAATADGASFPFRASPLSTKSTILNLPSRALLPSRVIRAASPPPCSSDLKKETSSLLAPFARNDNDDEQLALKRQKQEDPSANATTAEALFVAPPLSGPFSKKIIPKQILHQRKQAPGWLSSVLSAQGKAASGGVGAGNGGSGASQKRKAGTFFSPPRLTTTAVSPAPMMVQDTADALSLDSGGDLP